MYREYSAAQQGRWISPDPAGLAAVSLTDPQSWNRYAYVGNRPMTNVDPLGLWHCEGWSKEDWPNGVPGDEGACNNDAHGMWTADPGDSGYEDPNSWSIINAGLVFGASQSSDQDSELLAGLSSQFGNLEGLDVGGFGGFYTEAAQMADASANQLDSGGGDGGGCAGCDDHPGLRAFYNNPDCQNCGSLLHETRDVTQGIGVATFVVPVAVVGVGEIGGTLATARIFTPGSWLNSGPWWRIGWGVKGAYWSFRIAGRLVEFIKENGKIDLFKGPPR